MMMTTFMTERHKQATCDVLAIVGYWKVKYAMNEAHADKSLSVQEAENLFLIC